MALDTNDFVNKLITQKYTHLCVVPCSFAKNVINAVKTDISQVLIKKVMEQFNVGFIGKVSLDDPAAPEHFEDDFLGILTETVNGSMEVTQESISFSLQL